MVSIYRERFRLLHTPSSATTTTTTVWGQESVKRRLSLTAAKVKIAEEIRRRSRRRRDQKKTTKKSSTSPLPLQVSFSPPTNESSTSLARLRPVSVSAKPLQGPTEYVAAEVVPKAQVACLRIQSRMLLLLLLLLLLLVSVVEEEAEAVSRLRRRMSLAHAQKRAIGCGASTGPSWVPCGRPCLAGRRALGWALRLPGRSDLQTGQRKK